MPDAVLHDLLPARVVVSLLVAFAFVGVVVVAGAVFRDRTSHPPAHSHAPTTSSAPPATAPARP